MKRICLLSLLSLISLCGCKKQAQPLICETEPQEIVEDEPAIEIEEPIDLHLDSRIEEQVYFVARFVYGLNVFIISDAILVQESEYFDYYFSYCSYDYVNYGYAFTAKMTQFLTQYDKTNNTMLTYQCDDSILKNGVYSV